MPTFYFYEPSLNPAEVHNFPEKCNILFEENENNQKEAELVHLKTVDVWTNNIGTRFDTFIQQDY